MRRIEMERDADCRTTTIISFDGLPLAWKTDIHATDSEEKKQENALFKLCIPDEVACLLFLPRPGSLWRVDNIDL